MGRVRLYQRLADGARVQRNSITDRQTYEQLVSIEGRTLEAPQGEHDDLSMTFGFAVWAVDVPGPEPFVIVTGPPAPESRPNAPKVDTSWSRVPGTFLLPHRR